MQTCLLPCCLELHLVLSRKKGKPCVASTLWRLPLERPLTGARVLGCVPCPRVASTAVKGYSSNVWGALGTGLCSVLEAGDKPSQKDGSWAPRGQGKPR